MKARLSAASWPKTKSTRLNPKSSKGSIPSPLKLLTRSAKCWKASTASPFTGYQYFALADHIDFMIKRTLDGAELNPMSGRWETKTLFPKEFTAAKEALAIISATVHLKFDPLTVLRRFL